MMLAITSIAAIASIRASASEAAFLVASFMPFPPRPGRDSSPRERARTTARIYSEHPATIVRFDESPLSEHRRWQGRTVMRRHFDSRVTRLANLSKEIANQTFRVRRGG